MSDQYMVNKSLDEWLSYLEELHPIEIDMGLTRIKQVFSELAIHFPKTRVVTVAGTNGKGTTCAALESLLMAAQSSVAVYSSPHIHCFTERLRINQKNIDEQSFCRAFLQIEQARNAISLSYFEYTTLAALIIAAEKQPDVLLLEVGLGGRLDAVNVVDPDLAIITTIDLDHQQFLGDTRELIGAEKAGILRANGVAIIGEPDVPISVTEIIQSQQVQAYIQQRDFCYEELDKESFVWQFGDVVLRLPQPNIPLQNASTALMAFQQLGYSLDKPMIKTVFRNLNVEGRCQWLNPSNPMLIDVAHNPQAAQRLAEVIAKQDFEQLHLVVSVLQDKDLSGVFAAMGQFSPIWHCAPLNIPRGAAIEELVAAIDRRHRVIEYDSVLLACEGALAAKAITKNDLVVVFGSFYTVADVLTHFSPMPTEDD